MASESEMRLAVGAGCRMFCLFVDLLLQNSDRGALLLSIIDVLDVDPGGDDTSSLLSL